MCWTNSVTCQYVDMMVATTEFTARHMSQQQLISAAVKPPKSFGFSSPPLFFSFLIFNLMLHCQKTHAV